MKKVISLVICALVLVISSCKKGEDDPAVSLLSRKARVAGEWKMSSGKITIGIKDSTGAYASSVYTMDESSYSYDRIGNGANFKDKCSLRLSITKHGTIIIRQVMDSLEVELSGKWNFLGKIGSAKNKETIAVQLESTEGESDWYRTFNKGNMYFTYRIKELRNKKMVLTCKEELLQITSGASIYITAEYTLVQ